MPSIAEKLCGLAVPAKTDDATGADGKSAKNYIHGSDNSTNNEYLWRQILQLESWDDLDSDAQRYNTVLRR